MVGKYLKAKKRDAFGNRLGVCAVFMQGQTKSFQSFEYPFPPERQLAFVIAEQKKIIHIANVPWQPNSRFINWSNGLR